MKNPKVTVIMPVYNGEAFLRDAVQSILNQTFKDFELLVIDDGSKDNSTKIIETFHDQRIRLLKNETNLGLALVRNKGINEAKGEYIAWLDCDDISLPTRLAKQIHLLDSMPEIGLCGTWSNIIGEKQKENMLYPTNPEFLRCSMLFYNPFVTSSIMIRKECIEKYQLQFDASYPPAEDYDLWERCSRYFKITNIPEVLTLYRIHLNQTSTAMRENQRLAIWNVQERLLNKMNILPNVEEKNTHLEIGVDWIFRGTEAAVSSTQKWLEKLTDANNKTKTFPEPWFSEVLAERWKYSCFLATKNGYFAWKTYHSSILRHYSKIRFITYIHFLMYSLLKKPWK